MQSVETDDRNMAAIICAAIIGWLGLFHMMWCGSNQVPVPTEVTVVTISSITMLATSFRR